MKIIFSISHFRTDTSVSKITSEDFFLPSSNKSWNAHSDFLNEITKLLLPTGYFLRLAGLFTKSLGNLCHRGHTCTVSEAELELHTVTNQPQQPTPGKDPEGPVGAGIPPKGLAKGTTGLLSQPEQGEEWRSAACSGWGLVRIGGALLAATSTLFLLSFVNF